MLEADTTVLATGETGTGKELVARLIHENGARRRGKFVAQNCAALPETLLESELFGHALRRIHGRHRGPPRPVRGGGRGHDLLDEVGEMSPAMQLRLLRVLQEGEVRPVGGDRAPGRWTCGSSPPPTRIWRRSSVPGDFRQDLYYRLHVFPIPLPPLRERPEDIPTLADHFLRKYRTRARRAVPGISPEALRFLRAYPFPGNVRELENEIERAVVLADDGEPVGPSTCPSASGGAAPRRVVGRAR